jgi:hypothetical protein
MNLVNRLLSLTALVELVPWAISPVPTQQLMGIQLP